MTTDEQATPTPAGGNVPKAKVFVGNLSFRTRSKGLREAFENIGPVEGARVVTQGKRSMGFGFVQFASLEDATKAVGELHHSNLDDRKINVEISTSLNTNLKPANKRRPRKRPAKAEGAPDSPAAGQAQPQEVDPKTGVEIQKSDSATPKKRGPPRAKNPNPRKPATKAESPAPVDEAAGGEQPKPTKTAARRKSQKKKVAAPTTTKEPRPPRVPRVREARPPREFSNTVLYVSNIPFSLDDDQLKEAFAEFTPTSANVIRRKRNNLSKGFGFVQFAEEAHQKSALDAKHKSKIGDREVTVRKAHIRPEPTEVEAETTSTPDAQPASPEPEVKA